MYLGANGRGGVPGLGREDTDLGPDLSLSLWGSPSLSLKRAPLPLFHSLSATHFLWAGAVPGAGETE